MENFKVAAILLVGGGLLFFQLNVALAGKTDVLGLSPGMPLAEVLNSPTTRGWKCSERMMSPNVYTCYTEIGQLNFYVAPELAGKPLSKVHLFFKSADQEESVIKSISQQYAKDPQAVPDSRGKKWGFRWTLERELTLDVDVTSAPDYIMQLYSPTIIEGNAKAVKERESALHPTPKF